MKSRLWILLPAAGLYLIDVSLTLSGQSNEYWSGNYLTAIEANPIAYPLLTIHPWLFLSLSIVWLAIFSAIVIFWNHPAAGWMAVIIAGAHAIGVASWLTTIKPWGTVLAVGYIALTAQMSTWCWRKGNPNPPDRK